jgi:broad specificity phosphatase PhoE
MARLLLVRHGESTWNAAGRWQGWADIPLAEAGEAQSREARAAVRELGLTPFHRRSFLALQRTLAGEQISLDLLAEEIQPEAAEIAELDRLEPVLATA